MNIIQKSSKNLAGACKGNAFQSVIVVIVFYFMFNTDLAIIETLVWGDRFEHWGDVVFASIFIAYAGYSVVACARYNERMKD